MQGELINVALHHPHVNLKVIVRGLVETVDLLLRLISFGGVLNRLRFLPDSFEFWADFLLTLARRIVGVPQQRSFFGFDLWLRR